jgi:hypothetical protein
LRGEGGNEGGGGFEIDGQDLAAMPFGDGFEGVAVQNGGVVDEGVDFAEFLYEQRDRFWIAEIELDALPGDFWAELLIERKDAPPGGDKSVSSGQADAAASAGNESGIHG